MYSDLEMFAYPIAVVVFIATWLLPVRIARSVKVVFGAGVLTLAGIYTGSQAADPHSLTEPNGGIPDALVALVWAAGGLLYLAGVVLGDRTRLAKILELLGLGLTFLVFALPSSLVLLLPVIAVFAVPAIRKAFGSESEETVSGLSG